MLKRFYSSILIVCTIIFCLKATAVESESITLNISAKVWEKPDSINDFLSY